MLVVCTIAMSVLQLEVVLYYRKPAFEPSIEQKYSVSNFQTRHKMSSIWELFMRMDFFGGTTVVNRPNFVEVVAPGVLLDVAVFPAGYSEITAGIVL